jgi:hypothetical protein
MKSEPSQYLDTLVERFKRVATELFSFSTSEPEFITRKKGKYAYLIGRPIKRLAAALSLDREILILISSFEEQQQRTLETAREIINKYEFRLESTVAIVVHNDKEGNTRLPKWGRNHGLVVLPVYAGRMPANSTDLERQLSHELFSHDPFDITGPVSDDDKFFGRRNEALDLARKLQGGQIRSCLGIRKIGKTSVINRVIQEALKHHDCYCVMVDCSRDQIWSLRASELLQAISEAIQAAQASADRYAVVKAPLAMSSLSDASSNLLDVVKGIDKPVLIFVDEVDYITPGSPTAAHWADDFNVFWRNFRAVYQEALRTQRSMSVVVGGVSSKWFGEGAINGVENAALAFIPEEYLSPLARAATIAMIQKISRSAGLIFSEEAADAISAACSDMPFWVRKACSYIHVHIEIEKRPYSVDPGLTRQLVDTFMEQEGTTLAIVGLRHLFRVYPELESASLAGLEKTPKINTKYIILLRKYGVFDVSDPLRPSGEMMRRALVSHRDQQEVGQTPVQMPLALAGTSKDNSALDDWAENLALIGTQRNILEKKLRQLVLNFLRADSLAAKKRGTTKDRILACVTPSALTA